MNKKVLAGLIGAVLSIVLNCVVFGGCKARPQETTVIYAEIVGCYRDADHQSPSIDPAAYRVDFIWNNEVYQAKGAKSYYRALNHLYGQAWVRVVMEDGQIDKVVEVLE